MITVIVGGEEESLTIKKIISRYKLPRVISPSQPEAFASFCQLAVQSTQIICDVDRLGNRKTATRANDDIIVHLSESYIDNALDYNEDYLLLKVATAVETAIDLGLDVQVIVVEERAEEVLRYRWPEHWPKIQEEI